MVDISKIPIHRGLATKNWGTTTLQALVEKLGYILPKPDEIRRGDVFNLEAPELSKYAQVYFAKDVEAPLLSYVEYRKLPNLSLQMKPKELKVGDFVEIMTINISYVKAITRGVVVHSSGATQNRINRSKQKFKSMLKKYLTVCRSCTFQK